MRIHPTRLARLIEEGGVMTTQHIVDLEPARRTAILVAQVASLEVRIADATLAMFDKYVGSLFVKRNSGARPCRRRAMGPPAVSPCSISTPPILDGLCGCKELDSEQRRAASLELPTERMTLRQTLREALSDGFAQAGVLSCPSGIVHGFVDHCARRVYAPFSKWGRHAFTCSVSVICSPSSPARA
jgi:hypothetical protein